LRNYPASPKTIDEHLRKKRIDLQLSMSQLAVMLGVGITVTAIEKWEKNQNCPTHGHREQIIQFLGFEPATTNPTGGSQ
jgi:DNA-binding transcriptional regulator YiaG